MRAMRRALFIAYLLFTLPALAEDKVFPMPGQEATPNKEPGFIIEPPSVSFDEQFEEAEQIPEIPLDPVTRRFLLLDMDETATVSLEEYIDAALTRAAERFDKIDADGDGEATPDEYRAFRRTNREWWAQRFRMETKSETGEQNLQ
ncbi:MAG: hypothetical protein R8K46_05295 [Mariprofundaceae bacterium]